MYEQLHKMGSRLVKGMPTIKELEGKDAILLMGPTGSGKSVIANAMISGKDNLEVDEVNKIEVKDPVMYNDRV